MVRHYKYSLLADINTRNQPKYYILLFALAIISYVSWNDSPFTFLQYYFGRGIKCADQRNKWIVLTTSRYPTDDLKNLVLSHPCWNTTVIADNDTPADWYLSGVHFLSVEKQATMGALAQLLPFASSTRKNIGYLFAMANGAKWIYDADDSIKLAGQGLDQFDYKSTGSGLRYSSVVAGTFTNRNLTKRLFNPCQFFGYRKSWPLGFPKEYVSGHTNREDRMVLCKTMRTAAVQQGLTHYTSDNNLVYRLHHSGKVIDFPVPFNKHAPAITLSQGTYAPWTASNTLFHSRAFFTMFLPTTVSRSEDIWGSYFAQKLFHLIGEEVAFYPINSVSLGDFPSHKRFDDQFEKPFKNLERVLLFLDEWTCTYPTVDACSVALAKTFAEYGFFGQQDYNLITHWIQALQDLNYKFPPLKHASFNTEYMIQPFIKFANCRAANLDLGYSSTEREMSGAETAVRSYREILDWCEEGMANETKALRLPKPAAFEQLLNSGALQHRQNSVLIFVNNYPWRQSIGLLQRMYVPFFGMTIFCGTWNPSLFEHNSTLTIQKPLNFIHLGTNEMQSGRYYEFCFSKAREMRLQNVKGYFFVADDSLFNFWVPFEDNKVLNHGGNYK